MNIKIIQVGKGRKDLDVLAEDFLKRLRIFANMEVCEVGEVAVTKAFTANKAVGVEGEGILGRISDGDFVVALDERGREMDSVEFGRFLGEKKDLGVSLVFVVGGAYGLSNEVKERADMMLSFSKMTFTHQMIRVFLLEQIYRGFCILTGKNYHND